jgi:putative FmdB family regulatory protein
MPIYEYECTKCGHYLEALQKIADKPLRECPECGKHALKRLVSAPMFRLSGSGWYETDFKSDKEAKRNLADKGDRDAAPETKSEPAASDKSETRTDESKAEAKPAKSETKPSEPASTRRRTVVTKPGPRPAVRARKPAPRKPVRRAKR